MRKCRMEVTDHSIECRELFIVDIDGDIEREMSVGVTVRCKFTCEIGKRKATFEIRGGESSSPNRGVKGGCVDASGVEVHEGISDCLSCFQPRRFSPDSCIICDRAIKPGLADHKDSFPALPLQSSVQSKVPGRVFRNVGKTSVP